MRPLSRAQALFKPLLAAAAASGEAPLPLLPEVTQQLTLMAGSAIAMCMKREQENLEDIIYAAGGFAGIAEPARYRKVHNSVSQAANQLQMMRRTWQAVLPKPTIYHALGHVTNCVINAVTRQLLQPGAVKMDQVCGAMSGTPSPVTMFCCMSLTCYQTADYCVCVSKRLLLG